MTDVTDVTVLYTREVCMGELKYTQDELEAFLRDVQSRCCVALLEIVDRKENQAAERLEAIKLLREIMEF